MESGIENKDQLIKAGDWESEDHGSECVVSGDAKLELGERFGRSLRMRSFAGCCSCGIF